MSRLWLNNFFLWVEEHLCQEPQAPLPLARIFEGLQHSIAHIPGLQKGEEAHVDWKWLAGLVYAGTGGKKQCQVKTKKRVHICSVIWPWQVWHEPAICDLFTRHELPIGAYRLRMCMMCVETLFRSQCFNVQQAGSKKGSRKIEDQEDHLIIGARLNRPTSEPFQSSGPVTNGFLPSDRIRENLCKASCQSPASPKQPSSVVAVTTVRSLAGTSSKQAKASAHFVPCSCI